MNEQNEFGIHAESYKWIQRAFRMFPEIDEVIIFGSRAKGNFQPGSDIDLAIKGHNLEYSYAEKVRNVLEEGLYTLYFYDVVDYYHITNQALKEHIDRVGKVFYKPGQENISLKSRSL